MKALILAAGLGKRLSPFSDTTPKALFPIAGRPLLDITIRSLQRAGCSAILVNTHHLRHKVEAFIAGQDYAVPVLTTYEPTLLGTGGAIRNAAGFFDEHPFMVIHGDVVSDIDLGKVFDFHLHHECPATLIFHDSEQLNNVAIDADGFVTAFRVGTDEIPENGRLLTFTGIQVLDPEILDFVPDGAFMESVLAYERMMSTGRKIKAYVAERSYWQDIGTPQRYRQTVFDRMAPAAMLRAYPGHTSPDITCTGIAGDGSDRAWYRIASGDQTIVMADHGIREQEAVCQVDSFIDIGKHLETSGIPVPRIHLHDRFSGLVFLEDLGDTHLQEVVRSTGDLKSIRTCYERMVELLVKMSISGARNFDASRAYQSPSYDRTLIIEKECRYFQDAFLKEYLGKSASYQHLEGEYAILADRALAFSVEGFMHRDFQSRNIMVKNDAFYVIDFQGGRIGPIQYDLASLLIDPYVELSGSLQDALLDHCIGQLSSVRKIDPVKFRRSYIYCRLTRNLQILGAFGYLTRIKKKAHFEAYIPAAIRTLKRNLSVLEEKEFPGLRAVVERL